MRNWFSCKVSYEKMQEDGSQKKVSEEYLVDAIWYLKDTFNEDGELEEKDHPYGWKTYSVDSKIPEGEGLHSFAGINYQENKF